MSNSENALIIFIKNPETGKIKTQLASSDGEEKTFEIYQKLLKITLKIVTNVNCKKYLYYPDKIIKNDIWNNNLIIKKLQTGNDLGERMLNSFSEVFAEEGIKNVAIIGSDCPRLPPGFIQKAFDELRFNSFVLGPAYDGGYYLLAMRQLRYELFEKIVWSGPLVFSETVKKINKMVKTHYLLPALPEIQTVADWENFSKNGLNL